MSLKVILSRAARSLVGFFTGAVVLQAAETAAADADEAARRAAEDAGSSDARLGACARPAREAA